MIDIIEQMDRDKFEAKKLAPISAVHITWKTQQKIKASSLLAYRQSEHDAEDMLFGYPVVVHTEECKKDYWFVDEYGREITVDRKNVTLDHILKRE